MEKDNVLLRLKRVILNDKINMPNGLLEVVKKDINMVLSSYFELDEASFSLSIETDSEGKYEIAIGAKADKIKSPKFIK